MRFLMSRDDAEGAKEAWKSANLDIASYLPAFEREDEKMVAKLVETYSLGGLLN